MIRPCLRFPGWCAICFAAFLFLGAHPFLEAASDEPSDQLGDRRPWSRLSDAEKERLWIQWQDDSRQDEVVTADGRDAMLSDGWRSEVLAPPAPADEALDFRSSLALTYDAWIE